MCDFSHELTCHLTLFVITAVFTDPLHAPPPALQFDFTHTSTAHRFKVPFYSEYLSVCQEKRCSVFSISPFRWRPERGLLLAAGYRKAHVATINLVEHSIHNTATFSLFYIKTISFENKYAVLFYIDTENRLIVKKEQKGANK